MCERLCARERGVTEEAKHEHIISRVRRHFAAKEHAIDKASVRVRGTSWSTYVILLVVSHFLCTKNL